MDPRRVNLKCSCSGPIQESGLARAEAARQSRWSRCASDGAPVAQVEGKGGEGREEGEEGGWKGRGTEG